MLQEGGRIEGGDIGAEEGGGEVERAGDGEGAAEGAAGGSRGSINAEMRTDITVSHYPY